MKATPETLQKVAFPERDKTHLLGRLLYYMNPVDGRYDDLVKGNLKLNVLRDFTAGLIVAMVAIPMAMGFAMASGLRPEQGIIGGAVAGLVGALWGGSKYQVYGPTAAFIPVIAGIMATYGLSFLVLASLIAGIILMALGVARLGRLANLVPHSIVVGFTVGIAITIALSQIGEVLGLKAKLGTGFFDKLQGIVANLGTINGSAIIIGLLTFVITKYLLKVSPFIPAPLIALGAATLLSVTAFAGQGLTLIKDRYGSIPTDFFVLQMPAPLPTDVKVLWDLAYFVAAIVFVSAVESLLCSRMADRLAENKGTPYNPNKELWGQGLVQILIPLFNGFPHTGALARTATNVKVGAVSPLAGICKAVLKLLLALYLAKYLEYVPMACIGGILLYISTAMVKPAEVHEVLTQSRFHIGLMIYTAVTVVLTDFLTGVLTALLIYAVAYKFIVKKLEPGEAGHPAVYPSAGD
jgi:sulfate permease, SulP family